MKQVLFLCILFTSLTAQQTFNFLYPTPTIGETYLKVLNELNFNVWEGFLEGFYSQESHLKRDKCFGDTALNHLKSTLLLAESTTKQSFFFNMAKVIRNMAYLATDIKENCKVNQLLEDLMEFCEDHCDSKKMMTRLMMNFNTLSKIYAEIIGLLYDTDTDTMIDQYKVMQEMGNKIGEFVRIAMGFTYF